MSTIYHDILAIVAAGNAEQIEAARRELESRAAPLRGDEPEETPSVSATEDAAVRSSVAGLFDVSIASDGLTKSCVESRRAVTQLIQGLEGRA